MCAYTHAPLIGHPQADRALQVSAGGDREGEVAGRLDAAVLQEAPPVDGGPDQRRQSRRLVRQLPLRVRQQDPQGLRRSGARRYDLLRIYEYNTNIFV